MNTATTRDLLERETTITRTPAATAAAPRLDMYGPIHKALRHFMSDTLVRLGNADLGDDTERERVLDQLDALLTLLRGHLEHENDFLHTAIEARRPGGVRRFADDHVQHREAIGNLEDESQALRHARAEQRGVVAARLYRHLAIFIAENYEHMQREEIENNGALWSLYSDAELGEIHDQLLASVPPAEMALALRWMCGGLSVQELAGVFAGMREKAPREVFEALLDRARMELTDARWAKLARALGMPPVPGLMTV